MAAITNWVSYYRANRKDGGTIEALYSLDDEELAEIASGHNNDVGALRTTIANSGGGNVLLVPGPKGFVHFLHQGFATTPHLGGETILGFVQGNFSASPFKVIGRPSEAVTPIDQGWSATRVKSAPTACPTLGAILGAQDKDAFATLPGELDTLADRPNHLFIHPRMFTKADGPKTMRSKELAWALVTHLNEALTKAGTNEEQAEARAEQDHVEILLAFLWASENGLLTQVTLSDMPDSPHLNHQCELILKKIREQKTTPTGTSLDSASGLAVATHSLMLSMQKTETTRLQERAEDKSAKSLIRNLSPRQQELFVRLCTTHMQDTPVVPPFLKLCLAEKAPHRATNLISHETRKWKGTFSASGLSRFLAGGYLSQEGSQGEPGGFTVFMFHPKKPLAPGSTTESVIQGKGRIREFFDLDADDETLKYYQKKEFFVPINENELKIVLQTWHDLLVLLTVEGTIAAEGLALILEKYDDYYQVIQEMFASSEDFGLTVLVILDNHLQQFFEMVSEMDDVTRASSRERDFLWKQATRFLEKLDDREPPSVVIPQCLRKKPTGIGDTSEQSTANKKRKLSKTESDKQEVTNPEPQQDWSVPEGKTFLEFFGKKSTIDQGAWPRLVDPRFDEPKSMCVRYQVKGKCTHRCTLAHVPKSKMSAKIETAITAKFRKIYKN
jgi:hypothetical protein